MPLRASLDKIKKLREKAISSMNRDLFWAKNKEKRDRELKDQVAAKKYGGKGYGK